MNAEYSPGNPCARGRCMAATGGRCVSLFQDDSMLGRLVHGLAKWMAVAGGIVLVAVTAMMMISIIGRALIWAGLKPVSGDYELVSAGMGFAIFAFMPWTHLQRGHAMVTLLTDSFGRRANQFILVITDLLMLAAASFIAWRLYYGMLDKFSYKETTLLLRMPLGWGYAAGLVGAVVLVLVAAWVLGRSISYAITNKSEPRRMGAEL